jgi:predicted ATPase/DNA-binding winged helix-turn-helix (wHTH) protein
MSLGTNISADQQIIFGPFLLLPAEQLLLESGKPVRVGSRALEILAALVERAGDLVSKDELIQRVWPNTVVEETNLKVHIAALRRALGDGRDGNRYIVNIPGRGYRFVAAVSSPDALVTASATGTAARSRGLPASLTRIIGRSEAMQTTATLLSERRFVTLVGPGGIGKTTVALAVAAEAVSYNDGRIFADLAPLTDPLLLPSSLASLLGIALYSDNPVSRLHSFLENKQILIILDSCEHILAAVATLAEALLKGAPRLHILATSREPLRAEGEVVRRLPPLDTPPTDLLTAEEAVGFSAVQLFVDRAGSSSESFQLKDTDANHVAEICRRLDGNALAIELAAGRVEAFGIEGVASRLVDRFNLLTSGRRTAPPRHQALGATLDWSYDLLSDAERAVLRRLSVFAGNFTLDAAAAVVADEVTNPSDVICCVANLVSKSLISAETKIGRLRYRLLDTTRAYSRQKLKECNEFGEFARRHAEYYRDLFERASLECVTKNAADWLLVYGEQIDNVRAALNWAFSAEGSASTGVALTIAVVPLWLNLSLMDECLQRVKKALSRLDSDHLQAPMCEMQLYTALGVALYLIGPGPETKAAWKQVQTIAESLANTDYRLRALWGLWTVCVTGGEHRNGLSLANEFTKLAEEASDSEALLVGDRLIGTSHHFLGKQEAARRHIERMLDRSTSVSDPSEIIRFQCNQSIAARSYLAKVLWLQGYPEQALAAVEHTISDARAISHSHSLCYALASGACPITFFVGDLLVAERYVTMLFDDAVTHRLALWTKMGRGFKGTLLIRRGDLSAGVQLLRAATDELHQAGYALYHTAFLAELAQGLANGGEISTGLTTISEALAQAIRNNELWFMPELLRVKGEIALLESASGVETVAEECFAESLDLARQQKALSWELRSALSLARFRRTQNRTREARSLLGAVYSTFGEGFKTADLKSAKQMLDELN